MLTDREAAKQRAEKVVSELSGKVNVALRAGGRAGTVEPGLVLHNSLRPAVADMQKQLVAIYAQLDGASEPPLRDELSAMVSDRVIAFIRSTVAGVRGPHVRAAKRLAADLEASVRMSVPAAFDLAAYDAHKDKVQFQPAPSPIPLPSRRKQDKFGILDARTHHYEGDFRQGIGMLGAAVVFFDLDNFKAINNQFTEPIVDRELLTDLNKLVAALTEGRGFAYAEGGDEFLILLPNTNVKLAEAFVQELLAKLRAKRFIVNGEPVTVTASAGIAWSLDSDKAQACLDAAALAKKAAKDQGRDRYAIAPSLGDVDDRRLE
jgi:diguanylate cyclase (GGDEF)-like protein